MKTVAIHASGALRAAQRWLLLSHDGAKAWAEALLQIDSDEREAVITVIKERADSLPLGTAILTLLQTAPPSLRDDWQALAKHPGQAGSVSFGEAWLVVHPRLGWGFAKRIPRKHFADDRQRQAWIDNQEAFARLDHSRLLTALAVQEDDEAVTLISRWLPGKDFRQRLVAKGPVSEMRALALIGQASKGLQQLHKPGFCHGYLKPSNLLIGPAGKVYLSDIGLARDPRTDDVIEGLPIEAMDLLPWLAPECQTGAGGGFAADCYALGGILFHLLCGRQPFSGSSTRLATMHAKAQRPDVRHYAPQVSEETAKTIVKLMRIVPDKRYSKPAEIYARISYCRQQAQATPVATVDKPSGDAPGSDEAIDIKLLDDEPHASAEPAATSPNDIGMIEINLQTDDQLKLEPVAEEAFGIEPEPEDLLELDEPTESGPDIKHDETGFFLEDD